MTIPLLPPPEEGTVLDRRTLNRTLLARQHLLARAPIPPPDAIEHLVALQAQNPRDPYLALWSRLEPFDPMALSRLVEERWAARLTLMRGTLHLVLASDAAPLRAVMQGEVTRMFRASPFRRHLDGADLDALVARGTALVEEEPRSVAELARVLAEQWPDRDPDSLAYAVRYLVPVVQVPPRGLWNRSGAARVTTLRTWLGVAQLPSPDLPGLVRRYLRAFGPASVADIRVWSGLTGLRPVVERMRPSLRTYRDEEGRELVDVPDGVFADGSLDAPVRFLPEFDNVFLSHADRSRITGDDRWDARYARKGVFLVDGFFGGAWRLAASRREPASLAVLPMATLDEEPRERVEAEAARLLSFLRPEDPTASVHLARSG